MLNLAKIETIYKLVHPLLWTQPYNTQAKQCLVQKCWQLTETLGISMTHQDVLEEEQIGLGKA